MNNLSLLIVEGNIKKDTEIFIKAAGASASDNLKKLLLKLEPSVIIEVIHPANEIEVKSSLDKINLITINPSKKINLKKFDISFITTTHSIPESNAILIKTNHGTLLHTADWKIDNDPTLGANFDKNSFSQGN